MKVGPKTALFFSDLVMYCLSQILGFIGVSKEVYAGYLIFFIVIVICLLILPHEYPNIKVA